MKKIINNAGIIMPGLYRGVANSIVVKDDASLRDYNLKVNAVKKRDSEIDSLKKEVAELKSLILAGLNK